MEAGKVITISIYLLIGSSFIFANSVSCLGDLSLSSKVGYVMDFYYEIFRDSSFHKFIAQEPPFGSCKMLPSVPKLSVLQRSLIGEGSHRRLSSFFSINIETESTTELPSHPCEIIMIERVPCGVFVDPFELEHLHRLNVFDDIAVFGDTNLELPSILSNRSIVEVHKKLGPDFLLTHKNGVDISIELPFHARYPPLDDSGFAEARFGEPDLFLRCETKGKADNQSCLCLVENGGKEVGDDDIIWKIAAGKKAHAQFVSLLTFTSALLSALAIVFTSICFSDIKKHNFLIPFALRNSNHYAYKQNFRRLD